MLGRVEAAAQASNQEVHGSQAVNWESQSINKFSCMITCGNVVDRIASGQCFGLHCEVGFRVDIGGVHRDVTKPCADRIDVNTRAKQMGRRCVPNGMRADLLVLQRRNLIGRGLDVPLHQGVNTKASHTTAISIEEQMSVVGPPTRQRQQFGHSLCP